MLQGLFAACVLLAPHSIAPAAQHQDHESVAQEKGMPPTHYTLDQLEPKLVELMQTGILTKSPNASFRGKHKRESPFDGSYDWHSSVIAHWALLVTARINEDAALRKWVLARVPREAMLRELEYLQKRKTKRAPTFPYDEAWFVVFLGEWARHQDQGMDRLFEERLEMELRLLSTLETRSFPENIGVPKHRQDPKYTKTEADLAPSADRYCGFYQSSLFLYLALRWSDSPFVETQSRLDLWQTNVLEPKRAAIQAINSTYGYDFLAVPELLMLSDRFDESKETGDSSPGLRHQPSPLPQAPEWPDSVVIRTVHVLGYELSRLWPVAVDSGRGDEGARAHYKSQIERFLQREDLWIEDFPACSHWIPQYLFIGEWLRAGRP